MTKMANIILPERTAAALCVRWSWDIPSLPASAVALAFRRFR